jgi:hypothetical protein
MEDTMLYSSSVVLLIVTGIFCNPRYLVTTRSLLYLITERDFRSVAQ